MSQDHISTSASPTHSLKKRSRPLGDCTRRRTRTKLSPPSNSSASDQSVSDNSALIPTITSHRSTEASDVDTDASDSSELSESSEEPSSESSSSSEDDSDEGSELEDEEAEMGVVNLRANRGKKPSMKLRKNELDELGPDIRPWLKDFLPQLKAANDELEADRRAGKLTDKEIETDAEGKEQYIEMDLGLGVLEEQDPHANDDSSETDTSKDGNTKGQSKEEDILGKLMGREHRSEGAGIQEVDNAKDV